MNPHNGKILWACWTTGPALEQQVHSLSYHDDVSRLEVNCRHCSKNTLHYVIDEFRQVVYLPKILDHVWIVRLEPQSGGVFQNISDLVARHSIECPIPECFCSCRCCCGKGNKMISSRLHESQHSDWGLGAVCFSEIITTKTGVKTAPVGIPLNFICADYTSSRILHVYHKWFCCSWYVQF